MRSNDQIILKRLSNLSGIGSNSSGIIWQMFTNNPSSFSDWSAISPLYQEYRVLGMKLTWIPNANNWGNTTALAETQGLMILIPARDAGISQPGSNSAASSLDGARLDSIQQKRFVEIRMDSQLESEFFNVSAPVSTFGCAVYSSGLSVSAGYGVAYAEILCQFRGGN